MATKISQIPSAPEVSDAVAGLHAVRSAWRTRQAGREALTRFPSPPAVARAVEHLSAALYPVRLGGFRGAARSEDDFVAEQLRLALGLLRVEIAAEFEYWQSQSRAAFDDEQVDTIIRHFAASLPDARGLIDSDLEAGLVADPAARSIDEILISYPGALATLHHRLAHPLFDLGAPIVARVISELANARTGIDIHPGATIGPRFFIDHGTGVVIGETAIIGRNVRLYQHVTLGARSPLGLSRVTPCDRFARHPIVEEDVVIYAGATILGPVTIGRGSTIGGNVWLLEDVPAGSVVVQPEAICLARGEGAHLAARLAGEAA